MGMLLPTALPEADRAVLVARVNRATSTQRDALRALIILTLDEHGVRASARLVGCATSTVVKWRDRYRQRDLDGLGDLPRSGAPRIHAMSSADGSPPRPPASRRDRGGHGP